MAKFEGGKCYNFDQIKAAFGANTSFVLMKGGKVTAIILNKEMNPSVSDVTSTQELQVLVAGGDMRESLASKIEFDTEYPVFVKEGVNDWRYLGTYLYQSTSRDSRDISYYSKEADTTLDDIACIVHLRKLNKVSKKSFKATAA